MLSFVKSALPTLLLLPFLLVADEPPGAAPLPTSVSSEAPSPSGPPRFEASGSYSAGGKPALSVSLDTNLPAQSVVQVYLKREQFSVGGEPAPRLVDSKRQSLDAKRPAALHLETSAPLSPAWYSVEVVFDCRRQYPDVQKDPLCASDLRTAFRISVGDPEEIALEHEWGESRVLGALRRVDAAAEPKVLGWVSERLGKPTASSPMQEILFPETEGTLRALCEALAAGKAEEAARLRGEADRVYAREFTEYTLKQMQHWLVFLHQEYWLNKVHQRLVPEAWANFKADQRRRLDALEKAEADYRKAEDPVRKRIAALLTPAVPDCAAALRGVHDGYDKDLAAGCGRPGPASIGPSQQAGAIFQAHGLLKGRR